MARDFYNVEFTDTFGGQANYCWVRRAQVSLLPRDNIYTSAAGIAKERRAYDRELMSKAKAAMGLTGTRGRKIDFGDSIEFRPYRSCTVMFITWTDQEESES
jgi:hypothetical protein